MTAVVRGLQPGSFRAQGTIGGDGCMEPIEGTDWVKLDVPRSRPLKPSDGVTWASYALIAAMECEGHTHVLAWSGDEPVELELGGS